MFMVAQGLMQKPIPMMHETPQCGVSDLFAGNVQLSGIATTSLLSFVLFRRARRG